MITSGYQLMVNQFSEQRPTLENIWGDVFAADEPRRKSLIEISGSSGTGKSILLHQLMIRATMPEYYGGKESEVIFVDLDHNFDTRSFNELISNTLDHNFMLHSQTTPGKVKQMCLNSIIHIPCYSSDQFEFAFEMLDDILWDHKRVSLLAIDGLDTLYWEDCYYQLQRMVTHYKKLIQRLRQLCEKHNICCGYTVHTKYLTKGKPSSSNFQNSWIDYKLKLTESAEGKRFLNDQPIQINERGVEFL